MASARKHGITDYDMLHAYRNPTRVFDLDGLTMLIGSDRATTRDRCRHRRRDRLRHPCHGSPTQVPEVIPMPRSIQEILDHADDLAQRFEDYEPSVDDERPVEEYLLQRAVLTRAQSERQIIDAVIKARAIGTTWARIGQLLGTSPQAAQQRYSALTEPA